MAECMRVRKALKWKHTLVPRNMEQCIGTIKCRHCKHNDPYARGKKPGKNAKSNAVSPTANELAHTNRLSLAASAICSCAAMLAALYASPSTMVAGPSAQFSTYIHPFSPPLLIYPPSSAMPQSVFLWLSVTPLGHMFVPSFGASFRSSSEWGIGAKILPHSLMCFILGLPCTFIPRAFSLDLLKK
jgi:hypothetical protein